MSKQKGLPGAWISWFTMNNARHNRALRDLLDLQSSIEEFLAKYNLQETSSDFRSVFENIGQARIDTTEIAHLAGTKIRIAKYVESKNLSPLLDKLHNDLEDLKRVLFTRTLSSDVLGKRLLTLHESFKNFLTAISQIEYK
jgi:hypothetical protein